MHLRQEGQEYLAEEVIQEDYSEEDQLEVLPEAVFLEVGLLHQVRQEAFLEAARDNLGEGYLVELDLVQELEEYLETVEGAQVLSELLHRQVKFVYCLKINVLNILNLDIIITLNKFLGKNF